MSKLEMIELILAENDTHIIEYLSIFNTRTILEHGTIPTEDLPKPKSENSKEMELFIMQMIKDFDREDVMRCAFTFIHDLWKEVYSEQAKNDVAVG